MNAYLEITDGPDSGISRPLSTSESVTIGRDESCELALGDETVSRRHCRVQHDGRYWWLRDCGSHNGTLHNGRPVNNCMLYPGDLIRVGHTELTFRLEEEPEPDQGHSLL